jgi:hypothetical protein
LDFRLQALEKGAGRPAATRPPQPGPAAQAQPAPANPAASSSPVLTKVHSQWRRCRNPARWP